MDAGSLALFAPAASRVFGAQVAAALGRALAALEEREFEDGEHKIRPLESVRGRDAFIVHSLYGEPGQSVNDKLVRLLVLAGALRDAGAARVTVVAPYLAYARKDARTQPRDPVTTRYVAQMIESVGVDAVVTVDAHNLQAFQNSLRCRSEHLDAAALFAAHFDALLPAGAKIAVVSPDPGGIKRAERLRRALAHRRGDEPETAFFDKARALGKMRGGRIIGDVAGHQVLIVDDLISTGGTLAHAARACREAGAAAVFAAATHGLFTGAAPQTLATNDFDRIVITDTVPPFRLPPELVARKFTVLPIAPLVAEAIRRLHTGGSLTELRQS